MHVGRGVANEQPRQASRCARGRDAAVAGPHLAAVQGQYYFVIYLGARQSKPICQQQTNGSVMFTELFIFMPLAVRAPSDWQPYVTTEIL